MSDTCFYTVYDSVYKQIGEGCVKSIQKFYPEIDIFPFEIKREGDFNLKTFCDFHLEKGRELLDSYKRVISLDADSIMTNFCPDLFGEFDLGVVQNNIHFFGKAYKVYLNAGLTVCSNKQVWEEWMAIYQKLCGVKWEEYNEQNALNDLIKYNPVYRVKLLEFSDRSYGISSYDNYKKMSLYNHELYVGPKKLCIIHFAGRDWITETTTRRKEERIKYEQFLDGEASKKLQFLTK